MIAILGAGESGVGAALLAKARGLEAFVSDMGHIKPVYKHELERAGIPYEEGQHTFDRILGAEEIIKSSLSEGDEIEVDYNKEKDEIVVSSHKPKAKRSKKEDKA